MGGRFWDKSPILGFPLHWNDGGMTDGRLHNALALMLDEIVSTGLTWKAPVATFAVLPFTGNTSGDVRITLDTFTLYVWNGVAWVDPTGGRLNLKGVWDATNPPAGGSPTLADGTGTKGDYYVVTGTGTQDLGSGPIAFSPSDWVVYSGAIWEKADHTDVVTAVFGRQGTIIAQFGDYTHAQIGGQTADDHHDKAHIHDGIDGSGQVTHANTTGKTSDDHHPKSHAHDGVDGSGTVAHADTTGKTENDHHDRQHALSSGADHTGAITDAQHGARGGGTLHPVAVPAGLAGFMSGVDKTKLDGIGIKALNRMSFTFGDQGGAGVSKTGAGYAMRRLFVFPGTTEMGVTSLLSRILVERGGGAQTGSVRIYDQTNGFVICEQTGIDDAAPAIYIPIVSNLSADPAVWRLDLDGGVGSTVICYGVEFA